MRLFKYHSDSACDGPLDWGRYEKSPDGQVRALVSWKIYLTSCQLWKSKRWPPDPTHPPLPAEVGGLNCDCRCEWQMMHSYSLNLLV